MAADTKPRHKDSVLQVRYDPGSGHVSASCSLDGTIQIKSCFLEEFDGPGKASATGPFAGIDTDGDTVFKFNPGSWVNLFAFSPNSSQFVYGTHDSELHFASITEADVQAKKVKPQVVQGGGLPLLTGQFTKDNVLIASGYDKAPMVFKNEDGAWKKTGTLDAGVNKEKRAAIGNNAFGGRQVFFEGVELSETAKCKISDTKHQNYINCQQPFICDHDSGEVMTISTSDSNGYINFWDCASA